MFGRKEDLFVEDYSDFHYLFTANPHNWETNSKDYKTNILGSKGYIKVGKHHKKMLY